MGAQTRGLLRPATPGLWEEPLRPLLTGLVLTQGVVHLLGRRLADEADSGEHAPEQDHRHQRVVPQNADLLQVQYTKLRRVQDIGYGVQVGPALFEYENPNSELKKISRMFPYLSCVKPHA